MFVSDITMTDVGRSSKRERERKETVLPEESERMVETLVALFLSFAFFFTKQLGKKSIIFQTKNMNKRQLRFEREKERERGPKRQI